MHFPKEQYTLLVLLSQTIPFRDFFLLDQISLTNHRSDKLLFWFDYPLIFSIYKSKRFRLVCTFQIQIIKIFFNQKVSYIVRDDLFFICLIQPTISLKYIFFSISQIQLQWSSSQMFFKNTQPQSRSVILIFYANHFCNILIQHSVLTNKVSPFPQSFHDMFYVSDSITIK